MTSTFKWLLPLAVVMTVSTVRAEVIKQGPWHKVVDGRGGWRIVADGDHRFVEMTADFEIEHAPDLKIFLSPRPSAKLDSSNAIAGAVRVAKLTSWKGAARYALPAEIVLGKFKSIVIQCEQYSVLFATGDL